MNEELVGRSWTFHHRVRHDLTVPYVLGRGSSLHQGVEALASAYLLAFVEESCWRAAAPCVTAGEVPVGREFEFSHLAPSLPGDILSVEVTCTGLTGDKDMSWRATARNLRTGHVVGMVRHHRMRVVNRHRFAQRLR